MNELIIEGDPALLAQFDKELLEECAALGMVDQVTVETQTVQAKVAPGELGFGEEIRQILVGVADVLRASEKAITTLAEGIAKRLERNSLRWEITQNRITVVEKTSGESNIPESAEKIAEILRAQYAV